MRNRSAFSLMNPASVFLVISALVILEGGDGRIKQRIGF